MDMEGNSTTVEELRNAGASDLFVAYYETASALSMVETNAQREVENGPFTLEQLNDNPELGGGFFAALWNGNVLRARSHADSTNAKILERIDA